jgi:gamma-glutamyltranspeptidase/glutathione hydrolase
MLIGFALSLLDCISVAEPEQWLLTLAKTMALTNRTRLEEAEPLLNQALLERYRNEMIAHATCNRGTTHISIIDAEGNLASATLSNGEGCGHVLPGTGIMLNNMLGEDDINPGGLQKWIPGTRMASMMAPTLIERDGTRSVLGSGGSNRIRSAILQVLTHLVDHGMSADDAVNAPRIHVEGDLLSFEEGFTASEETALSRTGLKLDRWKGRNLFFGGVHLVNLSDTGLSAVGDPRRGGVGIVLE